MYHQFSVTELGDIIDRTYFFNYYEKQFSDILRKNEINVSLINIWGDAFALTDEILKSRRKSGVRGLYDYVLPEYNRETDGKGAILRKMVFACIALISFQKYIFGQARRDYSLHADNICYEGEDGLFMLPIHDYIQNQSWIDNLKLDEELKDSILKPIKENEHMDIDGFSFRNWIPVDAENPVSAKHTKESTDAEHTEESTDDCNEGSRTMGGTQLMEKIKEEAEKFMDDNKQKLGKGDINLVLWILNVMWNVGIETPRQLCKLLDLKTGYANLSRDIRTITGTGFALDSKDYTGYNYHGWKDSMNAKRLKLKKALLELEDICKDAGYVYRKSFD